jgi:uncharacterized glyoxalase superfamily protein PhnB
MLSNRSMPGATVIPELAYPDVGKAIDWLCAAYGFTLRLRIANHRAQLTIGDGAIIITERRSDLRDSDVGDQRCSIMVRVDDVERHSQRTLQYGAEILQAPADYPYGERQYVTRDLCGYRWTFSQSIADVDPKTWGGTLR